jgi:tetratricopeptide (TPR) repeat protein
VFEKPEHRTETLHDLASMLHKQRNFRAARRAFRAYLACDPAPKRETCSMLGLACTAMGDIPDGVEWYKKAIALDPGYKEAWLNLFQAYKEGGYVRRRRRCRR